MQNDSGSGQGSSNGGGRGSRPWWSRRPQAEQQQPPNSWDYPYDMDRPNQSNLNQNRFPQSGLSPSVPGEHLLDGFHPYAGFFRRLVAFLLDGIFLSIVLSISSAVSGSQIQGTSGIAILINFIYFVGLIGGPAGQTIGSKIVKIRVISVTGGPVGYPRALARQLFSILSGIILLAGYFMMLVTKKKQTLHDLLAGTVVVTERAVAQPLDQNDLYDPNS